MLHLWVGYWLNQSQIWDFLCKPRILGSCYLFNRSRKVICICQSLSHQLWVKLLLSPTHTFVCILFRGLGSAHFYSQTAFGYQCVFLYNSKERQKATGSPAVCRAPMKTPELSDINTWHYDFLWKRTSPTSKCPVIRYWRQNQIL